MLNIVLVQPEIPQNTGNISRTCAIIGARLHLVRPLGFSVDDRYLKRAGLDYWHELELFYYDSFADFERQRAHEGSFYMFSTHAKRLYTDVKYIDGDFLVFGRETAGLGSELIDKYSDTAVRIPMRESLRSLNLSNSAAIAAYEVMRQRGFEGLV